MNNSTKRSYDRLSNLSDVEQRGVGHVNCKARSFITLLYVTATRPGSSSPLQNPKRRARIHSKFSRNTDKLIIKSLGYMPPFCLHSSILQIPTGSFLSTYSSSWVQFGFFKIIHGAVHILHILPIPPARQSPESLLATFHV